MNMYLTEHSVQCKNM